MDRLTERLTKDLNGYTDYFNKQLDTLIGSRLTELEPLYKHMQKSAVEYLEQLNTELEKLPEAKRKSKRVQVQMQKQYVAQILPDIELAKAAQDPYVTEVLCQTVEYGYYTQAYSLEQTAKVKVNVPILNRAGVLGIIANDWVGDGHTYSDRIRVNTALVAKHSKEVVKDLVTKRLSYNEAANMLSDKIKERYSNAIRIIRTEMTRANSLGASYAGMENADILDGKYRDAVFDGRTSAMCRQDADYSREHPYPLDYDTPANPGIPGKRIPNHPNCRCCWRMILSAIGIENRRKLARKNDSKDSYGENYYTEAATFDDYAKERGLPTIKEMIQGDNPKRYLRPGETVKSLNKKVKRVKFNGKTVVVSKAAWAKDTTVNQVAVDKAVESVKMNMGTLTNDFGVTYTEEMEKRLRQAPTNARATWNNYVSRFNIVSTDHNGTACYNYSSRGIKINLKNDTKDLAMNFGKGQEVYRKAYSTIYHELGHHVSHLYAQDNGFNAWDDIADIFQSKKHPGETLTSMLKAEGEARIKGLASELKAAFKKHATDYEWLHEHGFIGEFNYNFYKEHGTLIGGPPKYSKAVVYNTLTKEIKDLPVIASGDISDMWDGITNGRAVGFMGHTFNNKQYWKTHSVGSEAFAEMFDATINNPASLEQIQRYFPKSYEIFKEMLDELGGL